MIENDVPIPYAPWSLKREVKGALSRLISKHSGPDGAQKDYLQALETMMVFPDQTMLDGDWGILHTDPEHPFVIGDAPVVTWERTASNSLLFGIGFAQPEVEAFLPICPTACIHVLPRVARTREVRQPSVVEVNIAQPRFSTQHCFANIRSHELDATLQPHFGAMRMGIDGFSVKHRDIGRLLFEILMRQAQTRDAWL